MAIFYEWPREIPLDKTARKRINRLTFSDASHTYQRLAIEGGFPDE
jgi:hypothetical protein